MSRRPSTSSAHIHVLPVAVPRSPGLHDVTRTRRSALRMQAAMPISNASSTAPYTGTELRTHIRPGAEDALALPSRMSDRLHYRDGRVTDLQGNPIASKP